MTNLWNFIEHKDFASLRDYLSSWVRKDKKNKLMGVTFVSDISPIEILKKYKNINDFELKFQKYNNYFLINAQRLVKKGDGKKKILGNFFIIETKHSNIWTIFTNESTEFFKNCVLNFIKINQPNMYKFFLSTKEIRTILEQIEIKTKNKLIIEKAVLYSHKEEGNITYERMSYEELFNIAENVDKYIDKVKFCLKDNNKINYRGYLSRDGISKFMDGNGDYYFDLCLPLISNIGLGKSSLFKNKNRKLGKLSINPIEIEFSSDVIKGPIDNYRVLLALDSIKNSSLVVYHSNPYLHASIFDYFDGSCHDIFITSSRTMSIVPSFISTEHALIKLFEAINKNFVEGDIKEGVSKEYSYSDFIN